MRNSLRFGITAVVWLMGLFSPVASATPPPNFDNELLVTLDDLPISMAFLPDGRLILVEKRGDIHICDPTTTPVQIAQYMDVTNLNLGGDRGLIDIAIDPDFSTNGYFYLYYTPMTPDRARLSRFEHQENSGGLTSTGDLLSETLLWEDTDNYISSVHYGGGLDFGPDGRLYWTPGDKATPEISQDLTRSAGSILRINSDGSIPIDNPFVDGPGGLEDAIWGYGLRNPFRASWDLATGRYFIGEVGGNDDAISWEDVHVATPASAGTNYGWPLCEGACNNPEFSSTCSCFLHDDPVFSYPHGGSGASIIGGFVYRGTQFPTDPYWGAYFYGDFVRGFIRYLTFDASDTLVTGDFAFESDASVLIHLELGPDGSLYYARGNGEIRRISFDGGNQAPTVDSLLVSPTGGEAPLQVTFDAMVSDGEGDSLTYEWLFGDGNSASGVVVGGVVPTEMHEYQSNGVYSARLKISDPGHTVFSDIVPIGVGTPPTVSITTPLDQSLFRAGELIGFSAVADDSDGVIQPGDVAWTVRFRHNEHFHPALEGITGLSGSFAIPTSGHDFSSNTAYVLDVLVTDADGLTAADTVEILPDKVDLTFDTVPSGLTIFIDGIPRSAPFLFDTLIDFEHTVSAPLLQCVEDTLGQTFVSWSDSGGATHTLTVPDQNESFIAQYQGGASCTQPPPDGLVMRLIADDRVTTEDTTVVFWEDQTPFGNDLVNVAGTPSLTAGVANGRNAIRFDGPNDALGKIGINGLPAGNQDRSLFVLIRYDADGSGGFEYGTEACNQVFGLNVTEGDGRLTVEGRCPPNNFVSPLDARGAGWHSHSALLASDSLHHYYNGVPIQSVAHTFQTGSDVALLAPDGDVDPGMDFEVAEILVYDRALTDAERNSVETYFRDRYLDGAVPDIEITSPSEGDTIPGPLATASWMSSGELGAAQQVSVHVDGDPPIVSGALTGAQPLTGLSAGPHTVIAELQAAGNIVLAADTVSFVTVTPDSTCTIVTDGLVLRLESDAGVTTSGPNLVAWNDLSGNTNHFAALGAPQRILTGGPNDRPYHAFDGVDDRGRRTSTLNGFPNGDQDRTLMWVARYVGQPHGGFGFGAAADNEAFTLTTDGSQLMVRGRGASNEFVSAEAGVGQGWLIHSADVQSNLLRHFRSRQLIDAQIHSFSTNLVESVIGSDLSGSEFAEIDVAAVFVYDRTLSEIERQRMIGYLEEKYFGIACPPINTPPLALADSALTTIGSSIEIDLLDNDFDAEGPLDTTSLRILSGPSHGTAELDADTGRIHYQHDGSMSYEDTLTYIVGDLGGAWTDRTPITIRLESTVATGGSGLPRRFALYPNRPNPTSGRTTIRFDLPVGTQVHLAIYDIRGRVVRNAIDGVSLAPGQHQFVWDGRDEAGRALASGVYFYRMRTPEFTSSRKAVLRQ